MKKPKPGTKQKDGTIFVAGDLFTEMFTTPISLSAASYDDMVEAIEMLNKKKAFNHDDWSMPTRDQMKTLIKNADKGRLKGSFDKAAEYWSSTPWTNKGTVLEKSALVLHFRKGFPEGVALPKPKAIGAFHCRPVRVVKDFDIKKFDRAMRSKP